jgi:quercetin dioxygenase-like cupin family protein
VNTLSFGSSITASGTNAARSNFNFGFRPYAYLRQTKEKMITRREMFVASIAVAATPGAFVLAEQAPVMGSTAFDWNAIPAKPSSSGSVRSFFKARTAALDELEAHATTLNPGQIPHPPHRHPNEELIVLEQGTLETLTSGEWKRVGPGSVIFNASNQLHGLRNVGAEPAIYHVINWKSAATPAA